MDDLTAILTPAMSAGGVVLIAVLMVLRGTLVPRNTVDMLRQDKDAQIDLWRQLAEGRQEVIGIQRTQLDLLSGTARTTERVLDAVSEAARANREGGSRAELAQAPKE